MPPSPTTTDLVSAAADRLRAAAATGVPCPPVRDLLGADDIDLAYAVQKTLADERRAAGARVAGRKIGLTSPAVQRQLGVHQPDFGILFDDMDVSALERVPTGRLLQPKAEAEIAFVLGADLDGGTLDAEAVRAAVDYAVAALEIVDSRVAGWDISIVDTVADNASSGLYVLGERRVRLDEFEPVDVTMALYVDRGQPGSRTPESPVEHGRSEPGSRRPSPPIEHGRPVSEGNGAACLGDPLNALLWLAKEARDRGEPLRRGQVVLSGALGPMVAVEPGVTVRAELSTLGPVNAIFADGKR